MKYLIPAKICCEHYDCDKTTDVMLSLEMEPIAIPDGWEIFTDRGDDPECYCPQHSQELNERYRTKR